MAKTQEQIFKELKEKFPDIKIGGYNYPDDYWNECIEQVKKYNIVDESNCNSEKSCE